MYHLRGLDFLIQQGKELSRAAESWGRGQKVCVCGLQWCSGTENLVGSLWFSPTPILGGEGATGTCVPGTG